MKRLNIAFILGLFIVVALLASSSALAAPAKKASPKGKTKIAAVKKKGSSARAPASINKKAKGLQNKKSSGRSIAAIKKKGAKVSAKPAAKTAPARQLAASSTRLPTGMAGLGLGAAAGVANSHKAFEVRGQARTLSMMLILRNGKENVKFVKVRQDYATEIPKTEF